MIYKVISGGQTGADQAGLRAARRLGLATGGSIPRGFLTEDGSCPSLRDFGLVEMATVMYPPRTFANVRASHGTMRFAFNFSTPGERCTLRAVQTCGKPHFDVNLKSPPPVEEASRWIHAHGIRILNVAGNRESTHPGVGRLTEEYLVALLMLLQKPQLSEFLLDLLQEV
jgi:hypothetical protein